MTTTTQTRSEHRYLREESYYNNCQSRKFFNGKIVIDIDQAGFRKRDARSAQYGCEKDIDIGKD